MNNKQKSFSGLITKYLGFLIDEYNYSITEQLYDNQPFGDGVIQLRSNKTTVFITLDRYFLSMSIRPTDEPDITILSIESLIDFLTHGKVRSIISRPRFSPMTTSVLEKHLASYVRALHKYCEPVLRGDVLWWIDACKYTLKKHSIEYRSMTGEDFPESDLARYIKLKEDEQNHS